MYDLHRQYLRCSEGHRTHHTRRSQSDHRDFSSHRRGGYIVDIINNTGICVDINFEQPSAINDPDIARA